MNNNKLIRLLEKLDRREMTRFLEFVQSPYFNKHQDVIQLTSYLSQIYPDFSDKKCNREVIFRHLYPALPHDQSKLAVIFTYTLRLAEKFLVMEQAPKEGLFENKSLFFKALRERNLLFLLKFSLGENVGKVNNSTGKKASNSIENDLEDSRFYEEQYRLSAEEDAIAMQLGQHESEFLTKKQQWLDAFYLSEKLKDGCELLQRSVLLKKTFEEDALLKKAVETVHQFPEKYDRFVAVSVYARVYELLESHNPEQYTPVSDFIRQRIHLLPAPALQNIYNYLQNFCIQQINLGNRRFLRELFELYRFQLEQNLLIVEGHLPEWHFKNIVTTGLRLDEHAWVRSFLENYRSSLRPEVEENAYSYNLAAYFYHLEKHDEVLRLLLQVEYTDVRYNLDAKSLLLRTYYDLDEEEALHSLTESFKQYLKRNKSLSEFQKKGYFNLLMFARKAFRLKISRDFTNPKKWQRDFLKLKDKFTGTEAVFNRSWLEGKIEALEA